MMKYCLLNRKVAQLKKMFLRCLHRLERKLMMMIMELQIKLLLKFVGPQGHVPHQSALQKKYTSVMICVCHSRSRFLSCMYIHDNFMKNQDSHTCAVVEVFHDITKIIITEVSTSMTINRASWKCFVKGDRHVASTVTERR